MLNKNAKLVFVSVIGTLLEWAEYSIYGYMAAQMGALFFPHVDQRTALIATFGIFAAGFIARPLGGIFFGHVGDKYGRKRALSVSIAMMGCATVSMGLLPTYQTIGILAPILLLICRIIQGFAASGEFNGAAIFLIEHAQPQRKNLAGSWAGSAAAAGMVTGALLVSVVSNDWMPNWAWRIPFWLGSLSCLVGLYLRNQISESPEYLAIQSQQLQQSTIPFVAILRDHKLMLLQTAGIAAFVGIYVYVCNIYFTSFLIQSAHFPARHAILIAAFGQCLVAIGIPIMGNLADKLGGRTILLLGLIGAITVAPIIFLLGMLQTIAMALSAQALYALFNAMTTAPIFNYLNQLFPTSQRYSGITIPWSLSVAIFGGTAPMISQYLVGSWQLTQGPAIYVSLSALVALIAVLARSPVNTSINSTLFDN